MISLIFKALFLPLFVVLERACQDFSIDVRMTSLAQWEDVKDGPLKNVFFSLLLCLFVIVKLQNDSTD